jgi:hypothetical protein
MQIFQNPKKSETFLVPVLHGEYQMGLYMQECALQGRNPSNYEIGSLYRSCWNMAHLLWVLGGVRKGTGDGFEMQINPLCSEGGKVHLSPWM